MAAIGSYQWNEQEHQLSRGGTVAPLQPKVADTLTALLSRRGEIIEKSDLMKMVWPDTRVEEVNLERNISLLRKALGDEAGWIETIPKRGYRLKAEESQQEVRRRIPWFTALAVVVLGVAVVVWQFYLPSRFVRLKPGQPYLAVIPFDGDHVAIDETLAAELVKSGHFSVLNPSVVRRYRWVGIAPSVMARIVGVELLLEGRFENGRLAARLSDVRSGRVIWAENYDASRQSLEECANAISVAIGKATAE